MTNFNIYTKAELIKKLKTTRADFGDTLTRLEAKQSECDAWQTTALDNRARIDAHEHAHKDALERITQLAEDLRKARAHRDRLLDERNELAELYRQTKQRAVIARLHREYPGSS